MFATQPVPILLPNHKDVCRHVIPQKVPFLTISIASIQIKTSDGSNVWLFVCRYNMKYQVMWSTNVHFCSHFVAISKKLKSVPSHCHWFNYHPKTLKRFVWVYCSANDYSVFCNVVKCLGKTSFGLTWLNTLWYDWAIVEEKSM